MGSLSLSTHKLGGMLPFHRWGDRGPERQGDFVRVTRPALRPSSQCLCFVASVGSTQLFPRQPHHTPHSHLPKPLHMPLLDIWCHLLPACQTHCVHSFCTSRASRAQASLTLRKQSQSPGESAPHGLLPPPLLLRGLLFHVHSLWAAASSVGGNGNGVSQPTAEESSGPAPAAVGIQGVSLLTLPCWDTGCQLLGHVPPTPAAPS